MHVLVVEHDPSLQRSLEFAMALRGHTLRITDRSEDALRLAHEQPCPLVLVGQTSDGAETTSLCRELRAMPDLSRATILVLAARDDPDAIVAALDAGADGYLSRPMDAGQLRRWLERVEERMRGAGVGLQPSDPRNRALIEHGTDVVLIVDGGGSITWAGPAVESVLGRSTSLLSRASIYTLCHPEDAQAVMLLLTSTIEGTELAPSADLRFLHLDGTWRDMEVRATDLQHDPRIGGIVLTARDITARKARERDAHQSQHDPLTGLPDRSLFQMYLDHALARAERRSEPVVIMFLDLDDLSRVNEDFGREAGDRVLTEVGHRLRTSLRATDTAARMGTDEFTILLEDVTTEHEAGVIAERLIQRFRVPFVIDGPAGQPTTVQISASIGLALSQPGVPTPPGQSALGELLRRADVALFRAKAAGKGRWVLSDTLGQPRPSAPPRATPGTSRLRRPGTGNLG